MDSCLAPRGLIGFGTLVFSRRTWRVALEAIMQRRPMLAAQRVGVHLLLGAACVALLALAGCAAAVSPARNAPAPSPTVRRSRNRRRDSSAGSVGGWG